MVLGALSSIDPIKLYEVDLSWYFALLVFFPLVARRRWRFPNVLNTLCAICLIAAVLIGGVVGNRMDKGLIYGIKLGLILLVFWPVFRANPRSAHFYLIGASVTVFANACLISLGAGLGLPTAWVVGDGRWQTVLSMPGAIGFPAIAAFAYWLFQIICIKPTVFASLLAVSSLAVAIAGGSRGIIVLCAITILMSVVLLVLRRRALITVIGVGLLLGGVGVLVLASPSASPGDSWIPARLDNFVRVLLVSRGNFAETDPERAQLMQLALNGIRNHPILGSGLQSITLATSDEPQGVHNRYLSAWAELGLLGLLGVCGITFSWLRMLPAAIAAIRADDLTYRFKCIWSITILLQFAVFGLFFPVGVQIDDWGFFITAETILTATLYNRTRGKAATLGGVPVASLPRLPHGPSSANRLRAGEIQ